MTDLTSAEAVVIEHLAAEFPAGEIRTPTLISIAKNVADMTHGDARRLQSKMTKIHKGRYDFKALMAVQPQGLAIPREEPKVETPEVEEEVEDVAAFDPQSEQDMLFVPKVDKTFVRWGNTRDVETIIKSGEFYPIWVYGLSGNGKTFMIEQICAKLKREMVRVQISEDSDEDALIGGYTLKDGNTVFEYGPVVKAALSGAVLLIDEMDRPERALMCMQGVLEGKPFLIKKTGELIKPAPGFTVVATGNTLGRGSDDGKFIAARILDEALLERFVLTFQQPYPTPAIEKKIILKHMEKYGKVDEEFADKLVLWAEAIRATYEEDAVDEVITTRRLCHITRTFSIFNDRERAIELCISRFDAATRAAFQDFYSKIDPGKTVNEADEDGNEKEAYDTIPF